MAVGRRSVLRQEHQEHHREDSKGLLLIVDLLARFLVDLISVAVGHFCEGIFPILWATKCM